MMGESNKRYDAGMIDEIRKAGMVLDKKDNSFLDELSRKVKSNSYVGPLDVKRKKVCEHIISNNE